VVSFADVQSIYRNEKNFPSLQAIPEDFYAKALSLEKTLEGEHRTHMLKLVEEIMVRRRNKIVLHALRLSGEVIPPVNINPVEEPFFKDIVKVVAGYKKTIAEEALVEEEKPEESKLETVSVRIIKAIPEIVGADSKSYGPFKEDDIVELPTENAEILIKHGVAEKTG
jgi:DNA replication initiation complex subunit (GINS family)